MKIAYINSTSAGGVANSVRFANMANCFEAVSSEISVYKPVRAQEQTLGGKIRRLICPDPRVVDWLAALSPRPEVVVLYGTDIRYLLPISKWCRKYSVRFVVEIVDWYELGDLPGLGPKLVLLATNSIFMKRPAKYADAFIVVSDYLRGFLLTKQIAEEQIVVIPAVMTERNLGGGDATEPDVGEKPHEISLVYAGSFNKRDKESFLLLGMLCRAWPKELPHLVIRLIGDPGGQNTAAHENAMIKSYGRLRREEAVLLVEESDYFLLLRDRERRFSKAGFPSKLAESLMLGTPVITNLTSDLERYVTDYVDSLTVSEITEQALFSIVAEAATLRQQNHFNRSEVSAKASLRFSPEVASNSLFSFLQTLRRGTAR